MPLRGRSFRGFPFDEEEGSGAWSELAARHPDIAARLRQRPAATTWARKRRPSSQDHTDDFGDNFGGFDRFPFDDIPPEFREHFPTHWNRRYGSRDEPPAEEGPAPPQQSPPQPQTPPHQNTAATQTEHEPEHTEEQTLPQYGLRNTVDLGQKSPADPSLVDAEDRNQRSMSAPPDARTQNQPNMSANHHEQAPPQEHHSNVRHIPIFVEGRDEPVINKNVDHGTHYADPKPHQQHQSPPQAHIDREQYFTDDGPHGFHHPPNFSRTFGTPFNKGFRQGPQPFTQQKAYPQNAFNRGASPQRAQSPKAPAHEEFVKVPVHHEHSAPKTDSTPSKQQQQQQQQHKQPSPQPQQPPPPQREQTPPKSQPTSNDPITQILSIQTDVLNLMTEVENFKGTKKDKRYLFLDEMLTRNLIKLDNIETEGKENIRQARKEAIRCIQKCIAVLEAKADSNANNAAPSPGPHDVEMNENAETAPEAVEPATENGEIEMKDAPKETDKVEAQVESQRIDEAQPAQEAKVEEKRETTPKPQEDKVEQKPELTVENVNTQPPAADTRPEDTKTEEKTDEQKVETKPSPKKKVVKKRDKSKDTKAAKDSDNKEASKDSNKSEDKVEGMQVDDKAQQGMEIDGATSQ